MLLQMFKRCLTYLLIWNIKETTLIKMNVTELELQVKDPQTLA